MVGQQTVDCVSNGVITPGSGAPVLTVRVDVLNEAADLGEVTNVATVDTLRDDRNVEFLTILFGDTLIRTQCVAYPQHRK